MQTATYDVTNTDYTNANQLGTLSSGQREALKNLYFWPSVFGLGLAAIFGGAMLLVFFAVVIGEAVGRHDIGWSTWLIGGGLLLGAAVYAFFIAPGSLGNLWTWSRIANGSTAMAEGRLVWRGGRYAGLVEGALLRLPRSVELAPGPYRFFYVAGTSQIVGAERLALNLTPDEGRAEVQQALQDVFHFVPDDLRKNQELRLSLRQRVQLIAGAMTSALVSLGLLVVFAAAMAAFVWYWGGVSAFKGGMAFVLPILGIAYFLFCIAAAFYQVFRVYEALLGRVESHSGVLEETVEIRRSGRNATTHVYYDVVDGRKFRVAQAAHNASIEHERYRLFYRPRSGRIMSIEPLADRAEAAGLTPILAS